MSSAYREKGRRAAKRSWGRCRDNVDPDGGASDDEYADRGPPVAFCDECRHVKRTTEEKVSRVNGTDTYICVTCFLGNRDRYTEASCCGALYEWPSAKGKLTVCHVRRHILCVSCPPLLLTERTMARRRRLQRGCHECKLEVAIAKARWPTPSSSDAGDKTTRRHVEPLFLIATRHMFATCEDAPSLLPTGLQHRLGFV